MRWGAEARRNLDRFVRHQGVFHSRLGQRRCERRSAAGHVWARLTRQPLDLRDRRPARRNLWS
eukprot:8777857-Pyramimonas_sp.AAC.1